MLLLFDAPAHHRLKLPDFDDPIKGGQTFDLPHSRAEEVATDPTLSVVEAISTATLSLTTGEVLGLMKRDELDALAIEAGLDPKDFRTKQDVVNALTEPTATGEGQPETPEPEQEN